MILEWTKRFSLSQIAPMVSPLTVNIGAGSVLSAILVQTMYLNTIVYTIKTIVFSITFDSNWKENILAAFSTVCFCRIPENWELNLRNSLWNLSFHPRSTRPHTTRALSKVSFSIFRRLSHRWVVAGLRNTFHLVRLFRLKNHEQFDNKLISTVIVQ